MFATNFPIFRARFPEYAALVAAAQPSEDTEFVTARNGLPTAKVTDPIHGPQTLCSAMDPERAALRDLERWAPGDAKAVVVLGVGLGYHLFAVAERYPGLPLAAVEARPLLIRKSLEARDWWPLLKRRDFTLCAPGGAAAALAAMRLPPNPAVFVHPALFKIDMRAYFPLRKELLSGGGDGKLRALSFIARGDLVPHTLADIHETLREMGHHVHSADISGVTREKELGDIVRRAAEDSQPDFVVTVGAVGLCEDVVGRLGVPVAAWFMDNPFGQLAFKKDEEGPRPELLGDKFIAFSWDEHYVPELEAHGVRAHYLPLATNPAVYFPRQATPEQRRSYGADISFIGTADRADDRNYRLACAGALDGRDVALWGGSGWRILQGEGFRYCGRADNRAECPLIYSLSKINLNFTAGQLVTALPIRVFDILACGGFLITDAREDLMRLFKPGADLIVFDDPKSLPAKVDYYLNRPEERARIAEHGRETVLARHTFRRRMDAMLRVIFEQETVSRF
jgi:spore maturation protein CgeB